MKIFLHTAIESHFISHILTAIDIKDPQLYPIKERVQITKTENFWAENEFFIHLENCLSNDEGSIAFLPSDSLPYPFSKTISLLALTSNNIAIITNETNNEAKELFRTIDIRQTYGTVTLVGFGPGNPDLLTIGGERALSNADVIFYDDLLEKEYLSKFKAELIYVGKRKGIHHREQGQINLLLLEEAKKGKNVVRLKGGDPMIFAHGGEEVEFLEANFIETKVIPGVSTGVALASLLKTPLTHRDISSSVAFLSGHCPVGLQVPDTETLVYYMAGSKIQELSQLIIEKGWSGDTPVLLVHNLSMPSQAEYRHTLYELAQEKISFPTPIIIMIGNVVSLVNEPALSIAKRRSKKLIHKRSHS